MSALERPADGWASLRQATRARVGLGRIGNTMALTDVLELQAAHAAARDAVHAPLDGPTLAAMLGGDTMEVRSRAADRTTYLKRPDLGRRLDPAYRAALVAQGFDVAIVVADGLSSVAVARHAPPLVACLRARLGLLTVAPVVIAHQARVAIGDEIGEALGARLVVVLIGERPGLTVADSLGIYLTLDPVVGRRDSERNCISNVHASGGLAPDAAADRLAWLMREALSLGLTGIGLKDAHVAALPAPVG